MIEGTAGDSDRSARGEPVLAEHEYGKFGMRLAKLRRDGPEGHELVDLDVELRLRGRFTEAYTRGDNSLVIATDSCKNALYALAEAHPLDSIEAFGRDLAGHFVERYAQVERAEVAIEQRAWCRIELGGRSHPTAFHGTQERATCRAVLDRERGLELASGLEGLSLLRSAGCSFHGFWSDEYRTLPDDHDRILATNVHALWVHADPAAAADWNARRASVRDALIEAFAVPPSASLQHTLHAMARAALAACEAIHSIELVLPNQHYARVDLTGFGGRPDADVFVPLAAPLGRIAGTLVRAGAAPRRREP